MVYWELAYIRGNELRRLLIKKHGCCAVIADFVSFYFGYKHYIGDEDLPQWLREPFPTLDLLGSSSQVANNWKKWK